MGDAERCERGRELVGGGGAERRRKREVHLVDAERAQVVREAGDGGAIARPGGGRVDDRQRGLAAREAAVGLLGVGGGDHADAERLEAGGERAAAVGRAQRHDDHVGVGLRVGGGEPLGRGGLAGPAGADVIVEWTTARGIDRLLGQLELVPARADLVRVAMHGNVERIQRREWARVEAAVPVRVHAIEDDAGGETVTLNVSGGGVLLKDHWQLPLGTDVQLELVVDPASVRALGRVVREAARDEKGVRIDSIARADEERLLRFVREREMAAMRAAKGL